MADKKTKVLVNTPAMEAIWPKLNEPDTKFKAEGEYSFRGRLDPANETHAAYMARVEVLVDEAFQQAKDQNPKFAKVMKRISPIKPELDDNGDETGYMVMNFKKVAQVTSKKNGKTYTFRVMLYDAQLQPLPRGVKIGGGSVLKASFEPYYYFNAKDKEAGVSARLEAVQVVELRQWQGKEGSSFGFGKEDGFDGSQLPAQDEQGDEFAGGEDTATAAPTAGKNKDF